MIKTNIMDKFHFVQSKIHTLETLPALLAVWKLRNHKVVFTNGCFDILHRGHVEYLAKAASAGDKMIIGLNTDTSVRKLKGPERPLQDQTTRSLVLASLQFVSAVILFDQETPYELIKAVQPDILAKGADYKPEDIVGYDIVKAKGGKVVTIDLVEGHSTTGIISKMK